MMAIKFVKMEGTGNDFIVIDNSEEKIEEGKMALISQILCLRKFSVGADGVLFVCKPTKEDYDIRMRIFNPDGSEAEMCGNGIRCFAKYVYEHKRGIVRGERLKVETLGGLVIPEVSYKEEKPNEIASVKVFMGKPVFHFLNKDFYVNKSIGKLKLTSLSLGNPHTVIIVNSFNDFDVGSVGKSIESHNAFPNRTNVNFVLLKSKNEISVRTYERGVGETLSCGTGATASALALNALGYIKNNEPVTVHTRGGDLIVELKPEGAYLKGPAEEVYEGEIVLNV